MKTSLVKSTIIIMAISLLGKITSFAVEALIAFFIGTSQISDSYYMVAGVQQVIYPMLSIGIWKIFLPEYKKRLTRISLEEADKFAQKSLSLFTILSVICSILIFAFADIIVLILAPGLNEYSLKITSELLRLSSPLYIFIIASAVLASMLQCHSKFLASQIREVVTHIPLIIMILLFYKFYGVKALVIGLVLGSLVRLLIEIPFINWGFKIKKENLKIKKDDLKIWKERLPSALVTSGVEQFNVMIDRMVASFLGEGVISALNYSSKLKGLFSGLLTEAICTAVYPNMAEEANKDDKKEYFKLIIKTINVISLFMIPISVITLFWPKLTVAVIFQRGNFDENSVNIVSIAFVGYAVGMIFTSWKTHLENVFYTLGNTKIVMKINLFSMILNLILNIVLSHFFGIIGISLSTSIAIFISCFLNIYFIKKYLKLDFNLFKIETMKIFICSILGCLLTKLAFSTLLINKYILIVIIFIIFIVFYIILNFLFKVGTFYDILNLIKLKIKGRIKNETI